MSSTYRLDGWRRATGRIGGTAIAAAVLAGGAGVTAPAFASQVPLLRPGPLAPDAPAVVILPDAPPPDSGPLLRPRLLPSDAPATVVITGTGGGDGPGPK
jgi:hypothetical protein